MFRTASVFLALALAGCAPSSDSGGALAPPTAADLVVYGRVWTGDTAAPWAGGVAVVGDTIAAVGDSATLAAWVGASTKVMDNGRALVTPGLMDGHAHFSSGGFQLASVDLRDAATPTEFIQRLKNYAKTLKPGEWITGGDWDHERWAGAPLPRRDWIDSVTPNNPVFVNRLDGHMGLANSLALKAARVSAATPDEAGGTIVRDADRTPTGVLKDGAQDAVYAAMPDATPEQMDSAMMRATNWAVSRGVTAVSAVSAPWAEVASARRLRQAGLLKTRISFYPALGGWHRVADSLKANGPGDDWIRVAGVKGFVDGSLGSGTALFFEPYADDPSTFGLLVTPEDSLRSWIGAADSAGLQVVVHAIGERANALILDIYDSVFTAHGQRDRRFRVEHAQHLRPQDVPRFARMGVIASMQPYHAADDGRWAEKRLGPERVKHSYVFRSLLDSGARLAFGSDWSVAPLDPMLGIAAAVTRQTLDGKNPGGWIPEEKISVDEALHAYSTGDAYAMFAERSLGELKPGYKADMLLLDRDLTTIRPDELWNAKVRTTMVGGKVVYQAAED
jgi:predicted amidohydrolase YtcJ